MKQKSKQNIEKAHRCFFLKMHSIQCVLAFAAAERILFLRVYLFAKKACGNIYFYESNAPQPFEFLSEQLLFSSSFQRLIKFNVRDDLVSPPSNRFESISSPFQIRFKSTGNTAGC